MIVPDYWDEHKEKRKLQWKPATITRFGWSEFTQKEAKELAVKRVRDLNSWLGEDVERREKRFLTIVAMVPIRRGIQYREAVASLRFTMYYSKYIRRYRFL